MTARLTAIATATWSLVGAAPAVLGQTVENPVKFDVSPAFRTIQPPARPQGAFFREHVVKKLPLPPEKAAALADTALQKKATTKLAIGPIKPFAGIGLGNFNITSDPPDTNGSVSKTHYVQWVNTGIAVFRQGDGQPRARACRG
jgi:hypothetical protein